MKLVKNTEFGETLFYSYYQIDSHAYELRYWVIIPEYNFTYGLLKQMTTIIETDE